MWKLDTPTVITPAEFQFLDQCMFLDSTGTSDYMCYIQDGTLRSKRLNTTDSKPMYLNNKIIETPLSILNSRTIRFTITLYSLPNEPIPKHLQIKYRDLLTYASQLVIATPIPNYD